MRDLRARILAVAVLALAPFAALAAERAIDKEVTVAATVDEVWDAWTTRAGIVGFFAPDAKIVAGFAPHMMPAYGTMLDEGEIAAIVAYIRSLGGEHP